ncbi:MAG: ATP-grasp domain-containing protein [Pseudobdellovibrionaceae bacterium]|nr:ATP-grasp domain-containing protein [Pseudobdellovibrionaceae bacterium]
MLALEAHRLGIIPVIFGRKKDPAQVVTAEFYEIDQTPPYFGKEHIPVLKQIDFLTFENEFLHISAITETFKKHNIAIEKIFPNPEAMNILQKRSSQKRLLDAWRLPTATWWDQIQLKNPLKANLSFPLVLKKNQGGYDGYGTRYVNSIAELNRILANGNGEEEWIGESFIRFKREMAVTVIRFANGLFAKLPLVESRQVNSRCDWVIGPMQHQRHKILLKKIKALLENINYIGAITFELFDTGKELIINEVAPRVHNTAHYSLDLFPLNQFAGHILAPFLPKGFKLPKMIKPINFCMVNLIGNENRSPTPIPIPQGNFFWHWYGKSEERIGRKMGHVTGVDKEKKPQALLREMLKVRDQLLHDVKGRYPDKLNAHLKE